ncbi:DEAD/DEAH box helicase [Candidatus Pacearchaeota archaeon]|nr:DEAD/DEAH box helicase [Candidatus Pacearchaeota archaeon]
MSESFLQKIEPRGYQKEIFDICKEKNCLVVLPTGVGKTLIALMLSIYTQEKNPGKKTLFLAPTRPLAEQHACYFEKHLPELFGELVLFTGKTDAEKRKELWQSADIIFSTPQCIQNDMKTGRYNLEEVSLLIIDESHRCLKNYSYTYIAEEYKKIPIRKVLGLTASPGTDRKTIEQIAKNLGIETIEIRTRESEDVKPYLEELDFKVIRLEFPQEFKEIDAVFKKLYQRKIEELKNRKLLFEPPTKTNVILLQKKLMQQIFSGNKNFNVLSGVSACAQAIKLSHAIELLETQTLSSVSKYIKNMYEQSAQKKSKAVQQIVKNEEFNRANIAISELLAKNIEHPKLLEVKSIIENIIKQYPQNKTIIFSQYRETVVKIAEEVNNIPGIKAKIFIGQAKKLGIGYSQKEQQEIMSEFRVGTINVICATSIAEEGLDIPEVNTVIFYEPIPSAIRKIQRAGRTARLMKGELIILVTNDTLDEIFHYASKSRERKMYKAIENIKKDLDQGYSFHSKSEIEEQKKLF